MTAVPCERISWAALMDYAAGDSSEGDAASLEAHLFSCSECGARAREAESLIQAVALTVASGEVGGFLADAVLNRLAREGVRSRIFTLSPGDVVPCAVWEDDELMVLRLRGEFGGSATVTVSQRVAGREVSRTTGEVVPSHGEIVFATPAAWIRQLPVTEVELVLTSGDGDDERPLGTYTLLHGGSLRR